MGSSLSQERKHTNSRKLTKLRKEMRKLNSNDSGFRLRKWQNKRIFAKMRSHVKSRSSHNSREDQTNIEEDPFKNLGQRQSSEYAIGNIRPLNDFHLMNNKVQEKRPRLNLKELSSLIEEEGSNLFEDDESGGTDIPKKFLQSNSINRFSARRSSNYSHSSKTVKSKQISLGKVNKISMNNSKSRFGSGERGLLAKKEVSSEISLGNMTNKLKSPKRIMKLKIKKIIPLLESSTSRRDKMIISQKLLLEALPFSSMYRISLYVETLSKDRPTPRIQRLRILNHHGMRLKEGENFAAILSKFGFLPKKFLMNRHEALFENHYISLRNAFLRLFLNLQIRVSSENIANLSLNMEGFHVEERTEKRKWKVLPVCVEKGHVRLIFIPDQDIPQQNRINEFVKQGPEKVKKSFMIVGMGETDCGLVFKAEDCNEILKDWCSPQYPMDRTKVRISSLDFDESEQKKVIGKCKDAVISEIGSDNMPTPVFMGHSNKIVEDLKWKLLQSREGAMNQKQFRYTTNNDLLCKGGDQQDNDEEQSRRLSSEKYIAKDREMPPSPKIKSTKHIKSRMSIFGKPKKDESKKDKLNAEILDSKNVNLEDHFGNQNVNIPMRKVSTPWNFKENNSEKKHSFLKKILEKKTQKSFFVDLKVPQALFEQVFEQLDWQNCGEGGWSTEKIFSIRKEAFTWCFAELDSEEVFGEKEYRDRLVDLRNRYTIHRKQMQNEPDPLRERVFKQQKRLSPKDGKDLSQALDRKRFREFMISQRVLPVGLKSMTEWVSQSLWGLKLRRGSSAALGPISHGYSDLLFASPDWKLQISASTQDYQFDTISRQKMKLPGQWRRIRAKLETSNSLDLEGVFEFLRLEFFRLVQVDPEQLNDLHLQLGETSTLYVYQKHLLELRMARWKIKMKTRVELIKKIKPFNMKGESVIQGESQLQELSRIFSKLSMSIQEPLSNSSVNMMENNNSGFNPGQPMANSCDSEGPADFISQNVTKSVNSLRLSSLQEEESLKFSDLCMMNANMISKSTSKIRSISSNTKRTPSVQVINSMQKRSLSNNSSFAGNLPDSEDVDQQVPRLISGFEEEANLCEKLSSDDMNMNLNQIVKSFNIQEVSLIFDESDPTAKFVPLLFRIKFFLVSLRNPKKSQKRKGIILVVDMDHFYTHGCRHYKDVRLSSPKPKNLRDLARSGTFNFSQKGKDKNLIGKMANEEPVFRSSLQTGSQPDIKENITHKCTGDPKAKLTQSGLETGYQKNRIVLCSSRKISMESVKRSTDGNLIESFQIQPPRQKSFFSQRQISKKSVRNRRRKMRRNIEIKPPVFEAKLECMCTTEVSGEDLHAIIQENVGNGHLGILVYMLVAANITVFQLDSGLLVLNDPQKA